MSIIAPKFRLGYFLKSITDNLFWVIVLMTLIGIPIVQIVLFFVDLPVIDGELVNPFLALTWLSHPESALPLIKALLYTDISESQSFQDSDSPR